MKKFTLTTEYTQHELELLIEQSLKKILLQELPGLIAQFANSPPPNNLQNLLSRKEVRKILGISYPTLLKLERQGLLKGSIISGSYRYSEKQITKFLEETKNIRQRA